jgi:hypothetical protein
LGIFSEAGPTLAIQWTKWACKLTYGGGNPFDPFYGDVYFLRTQPKEGDYYFMAGIAATTAPGGKETPPDGAPLLYQKASNKIIYVHGHYEEEGEYAESDSYTHIPTPIRKIKIQKRNLVVPVHIAALLRVRYPQQNKLSELAADHIDKDINNGMYIQFDDDKLTGPKQLKDYRTPTQTKVEIPESNVFLQPPTKETDVFIDGFFVKVSANALTPGKTHALKFGINKKYKTGNDEIYYHYDMQYDIDVEK